MFFMEIKFLSANIAFDMMVNLNKLKKMLEIQIAG